MRYQSFGCAFIILWRKNGTIYEVLLQLRQNTGYMDGYYDLAASGHLEPAESLQDCAIRETKEETNIKLKPENTKFLFLNHSIRENYLRAIFAAKLPDGAEPKICESDKNGGFIWAKPHELPENVLPFIPKLFQAIELGLNYDDADFSNLARKVIQSSSTHLPL